MQRLVKTLHLRRSRLVWNCQIVISACLVAFACTPASPLEQLTKGETGRVVHILDGDTLALNTGLVVRLACVTSPNFKDTFGKESSRILEDSTKGRHIQIYYGGLTRDKYGRALAHIKTVDRLGPSEWINQKLIQQGSAWVDVYPDTAPGCLPLVEAEAKAIKTRTGLWRKRFYALKKAEECCAETGVVFISGTLKSGQNFTEPATSCALTLERNAPTITYKGPCDAAHLITDTRVHVRGYYRDGTLDARDALNVRILSADTD